MPGFLRRRRQIHREANGLRSVPRLGCKVECLLSAKEVDLERIFSSGGIEAAWNAVMPGLETFEIPDGTGGVNPGDRRALFYLLSYFEPRSVLEVGTHIGASTVYMAAALKRCRKVEDERRLQLVSVDARDVNDPISKPWIQHGTRFSPAEMIDRMGCDYFAEFASKTSLDYMARFEPRVDFIFLDGDHAAKTVYREIPAALQLLNEDGLILIHDYFPGAKPLWSDGCVIPGPFLATERLRSEGAQFEVLPLGRLPWPTKLKSDVTSLALLVRKTSSQRHAPDPRPAASHVIATGPSGG
jgi:predicted O-methyltransferase YrrM